MEKGTHLCIEFTALYCHCAGRPFREYHSSSAALGQQRPEVTKQLPVCDWLATRKALCDVNRHFTLSGVADQSPTSGCLVTSGRCWPSAADEEWYSPKRPSSTVTVNSSELNTKVSAFFLRVSGNGAIACYFP